jgi:hypothetical protein
VSRKKFKKFGFGKSLGFQVQINDFRLNVEFLGMTLKTALQEVATYSRYHRFNNTWDVNFLSTLSFNLPWVVIPWPKIRL